MRLYGTFLAELRFLLDGHVETDICSDHKTEGSWALLCFRAVTPCLKDFRLCKHGGHSSLQTIQ